MRAMELPISRSMIVPLIVASALFMENLDGTIITTALPQMAVTFGTTPIHLSVGITSYVLSLAIFIPVSGWVADRFGAHTMFRNAITVFTIGSLLYAVFATTSSSSTAARVLQGLGGAMMVPVGRLVMFRSVERKSEFVTAMAYLTVPATDRPDPWPADRRLHHDLCELALDLLSQRAGWHSGHRARDALHRELSRTEYAVARLGRLPAARAPRSRASSMIAIWSSGQ